MRVRNLHFYEITWNNDLWMVLDICYIIQKIKVVETWNIHQLFKLAFTKTFPYRNIYLACFFVPYETSLYVIKYSETSLIYIVNICEKLQNVHYDEALSEKNNKVHIKKILVIYIKIGIIIYDINASNIIYKKKLLFYCPVICLLFIMNMYIIYIYVHLKRNRSFFFFFLSKFFGA